MAKKYSLRKNVIVNNNVITIYKLENQFCVSDFIRAMEKALKYIRRKNIASIIIKCLCSRNHIFPDACVPIAALICEYQTTFNININVDIGENSYLKSCHFNNPLNLSPEQIKKTKNPLNKIFMYSASNENGSQAVALNQAFVDYMSRTVECEEGVLSGMLWCIYEVMDNVLIHSESNYGYIMAQYHKKTNRLAICIYDCGIGIYNSLIKGSIKPTSELDSIKLSITEGISDGQGQGNGLYGLSQFIKANGGRLVISTGSSTLEYKNDKLKEWSNNPVLSKENRSTTIDFQLELSKKTDLKSALRSIGGIDDFDIRIEDMIQEDSNVLRYKIVDQTDGTSTRSSGRALRIDVLNIIKRYQSPIILDFSDILIVSSSFMDEFVAKMYIDLGSVKFNQLISIVNMNENLIHICNRAIAMRINQEWNS